tara:strand:- start:35 stop:1042 length:1008 start_codon:yes stop_codon:yes gene_type:complete
MKKILISLLIFIFFFEFTSMIFTKYKLLIFNEIPKYSFKETNLFDWKEKDENGIDWHKKNFRSSHSTRCFDVNYEFNNIGARDVNDYFTNDPDKSIILIGDSFAEGYGVNIDKTFAKIVEKKTGKKVLNFGISGSDPKIQIEKFINDGSNFNFDELIYFFLPSNDYLTESKKSDDTKNSLSGFNLIKIKYDFANFLARFTYSYNFLRSAAYLLEINFSNNFENLSYFYKNHKNVDHTFEYINKIVSYKDVKSYIIIIPIIHDININQKNKVNYKNLYWYKEINKLANLNNSKIVDLMDFTDFKIKSKYFHSCDGHWSDFGNRFAANSFLKIYNEN